MEAESPAADLPSIRSLLHLKKQYDAPATQDLPAAYRSNSAKEKLYVWAAGNFERQIRQKHSELKPLCLASVNECGVHKLAFTYIKPTVLPYAHLFDVDACARFISDYIFYQIGATPTSRVRSPTYVLATQMGNSLEMSDVLVSFLTGFGFQAFVVCGWADRKTAQMDRTKETCAALHTEQTDVEGQQSSPSLKYSVKEPPQLKSKYLEFLDRLERDQVGTVASSSSASSRHQLAEEDETKELFHAWVYVQVKGSTSFFVETSTGERKSLAAECYKSINSVWNQNNYWLCMSDGWRNKSSLDLDSNDLWVKFVADLECESEQRAPNVAAAALEEDANAAADARRSDEQGCDAPAAQKRLFGIVESWLEPLQVPSDCYDLIYRMGQKAENFDCVKVESFAPYLLKDGMVQCVQIFKSGHVAASASQPPPVSMVERFRFRADKMMCRETSLDSHLVSEHFGPGRTDRLRKHRFYKLSSNHPTEYVSKFYSKARPDELETRIFKEMSIEEHYKDRLDRLSCMRATFVVGEKKFGPADPSKGTSKEVTKISERFETPDGDIACEENRTNLGRVLDTTRIMERVFDLDNDRIVLKFERAGGQILCQQVEFLAPRVSDDDRVQQQAAASATLGQDDVKVFVVDPRQRKPCLRELSLVYAEQLHMQKLAIERVEKSEREMNKLLEDRMRELSANEMEVEIYDVKRNAQVKRGRQEQDRLARMKQESFLDIEIDFLAPYMQRFADVEAITKMQACEVRDECLSNIKSSLKEKERELEDQLSSAKTELAARYGFLPLEDINSKKFYINVLEARLKRQREHSEEYFAKAEQKVLNDARLQIIFT